MQPTARILDIGSGSGRVAIALTQAIQLPGSYDGLDINEPAVAWCRAAMTTRWPHFRFQYADIANSFYRPRGSVSGDTYRFPFPDNQFDVVIVASVFTHMLPPVTAHYLCEISRVLANDGKCFCTGFYYNQTDGPAAGGSLSFPFVADGHALADAENPEAAVAYEEGTFRGFVDSSGMEVASPLRMGSWRDPQAPRWPQGFQDHFVLTPVRSSP